MAITERRSVLTVSEKMTEALKEQCKLQKQIRLMKEIGTPSGKNILPELTRKARETGQPTVIGPDYPNLDKIPRMYGDRVIYGGETAVVQGCGVFMIPSYEKGGK